VLTRIENASLCEGNGFDCSIQDYIIFKFILLLSQLHDFAPRHVETIFENVTVNPLIGTQTLILSAGQEMFPLLWNPPLGLFLSQLHARNVEGRASVCIIGQIADPGFEISVGRPVLL
jgi:hypothetical protein